VGMGWEFGENSEGGSKQGSGEDIITGGTLGTLEKLEWVSCGLGEEVRCLGFC
jgi:hypothetical protein